MTGLRRFSPVFGDEPVDAEPDRKPAGDGENVNQILVDLLDVRKERYDPGRDADMIKDDMRVVVSEIMKQADGGGD